MIGVLSCAVLYPALVCSPILLSGSARVTQTELSMSLGHNIIIQQAQPGPDRPGPLHFHLHIWPGVKSSQCTQACVWVESANQEHEKNTSFSK